MLQTATTSHAITPRSASRDEASARIALMAARIAGELYRASRVAKKLVLVAQNSRTMAARIGDRALGLDVLSEYFATLSRETIRLSEEVNSLATKVASGSVGRWRVRQFLSAVLRCQQIEPEAARSDRLLICVGSAQQQLLRFGRELASQHKLLARRLGELESNARSASTLAVNVRLEATKTGEHEPILRSMALDLESLSLTIGEHAKCAIHLLSQMREQHDLP